MARLALAGPQVLNGGIGGRLLPVPAKIAADAVLAGGLAFLGLAVLAWPTGKHSCLTCSWMCSRDFQMLVSAFIGLLGAAHAAAGGGFLFWRSHPTLATGIFLALEGAVLLAVCLLEPASGEQRDAGRAALPGLSAAAPALAAAPFFHPAARKPPPPA